MNILWKILTTVGEKLTSFFSLFAAIFDFFVLWYGGKIIAKRKKVICRLIIINAIGQNNDTVL